MARFLALSIWAVALYVAFGNFAPLDFALKFLDWLIFLTALAAIIGVLVALLWLSERDARRTEKNGPVINGNVYIYVSQDDAARAINAVQANNTAVTPVMIEAEKSE